MIKKHLIKLSCVLLAFATLFCCSACGAITDDTTTTVSNTSDTTTTSPNSDTTTTAPVEQLSNEDQAFLNDFYALLSSFDERYASGIGNIKIYYDFADETDLKYIVYIGFINSETFDSENLSFVVPMNKCKEFLNTCGKHYDAITEKEYRIVLSQLSKDATKEDVEFYKFLNTYTLNVINSANS